jgi:hypothetical protein
METHLPKKKKKKQNSKTLNPKPIKSYSTSRYMKKRGKRRAPALWDAAQTCLGDADKQDWMLKE